MKLRYMLITMILFISCSTVGKKNPSNENLVTDTILSNRDSQKDKESEYLKVRNNYVKHLQGLEKAGKNIDSLTKVDNVVLKELENKLRVILKESHFSDQGKINLETLLGFIGFGMLDGLTFEEDSMRIFYTSKNIFLDYFRESKIFQFDELTPNNLKNIFNSTFVSDAQVSNFTNIKIRSTESMQAYGMVSMIAQMNGPFCPEYLYVFVIMNNYVYMAEKHLKRPIKEISKCKTVWDSINGEAERQLDKYHASNLKDSMTFNNYLRLEEKAFDKYCECYQNELRNDSQFEEIKKQFEKIINFLEKGKK